MIPRSEIEAEELRGEAQRTLDAQRSGIQRNQLGQFATPTAVAVQMAELAKGYLPPGLGVRFLDPALGTGVFFYAVAKAVGNRLQAARGYEIDPQVAEIARELWEPFGLAVLGGDFCTAKAPLEENEKANLLICNPPYVRHHHLSADRKTVLKKQLGAGGHYLSGLAGLYCYFLLIAQRWLSRNGVATWIIPAEFLDVNYGKSVKRYLAQDVTLIRLHRFDPDDVQFSDAIVSSVILLFQAGKPSAEHQVEFTSGNTLQDPKCRKFIALNTLHEAAKWGPLFDMQFLGAAAPKIDGSSRSNLMIGDLFTVKRGLATGANAFFILNRRQAESLNLPKRYLRPILPSPRAIPGLVIEANGDGVPSGLPELVLLDCDLPFQRIQNEAPELFAYLESGKQQGVSEGYLAAHRGLWYRQERRPPAPILCTYMGRQSGGRALRFIRNKSSATAPNVYLLLYPKPHLASIIENDPVIIERVFEALSEITGDLVAGGRVYGGGLRKIEPRELTKIQLPLWLGEQYLALSQFRLEQESAKN